MSNFESEFTQVSFEETKRLPEINQTEEQENIRHEAKLHLCQQLLMLKNYLKAIKNEKGRK